jgi:DNA end-binding protein Ku
MSFGLVSIPIKMYTAASAGGIAFNMLHARCGSRIKQQTFCPTCNEVVQRNELVRGYEYAKDQYVRFTDEELKALEGETSKVIDIAEFVPLAKVDPIYFEKTYFLGPDKGARRRGSRRRDGQSDRVALASFVMRGKRPRAHPPGAERAHAHTMYFADEVRDFGEVDKGEGAKMREGELQLALRLIDELSHEDFKPEQYHDEYRNRVLEMANAKAEGNEVTAAAPEAPRAQVIDLMDALKESLARRAGGDGRGAAGDGAKKPVAPRRIAPRGSARAQAGKK